MKELIENLYPMNACLLGEGYDSRLEYLKHLLPLDVIEIPSGTKVGTWTVPDEWIVRDAFVRKEGSEEKIIDYKKNPLHLAIGSTPQHQFLELKDLKDHLLYMDDMSDSIPYSYMFYNDSWGFSVAKNDIKTKLVYDADGNLICEGGTCFPELKDFDESVGKVTIEGVEYKPKFKDSLEEGIYEVFIDTEYKPGTMKIGVHTIKGVSEREILLFAHLDHPYQANDNLSAVACLVDLATKLKAEHTIKIIFCPETIGSVAYAHTQDISKVDFVIAVDICGNDNTLLLQKSFDAEHRLNRVSHVAVQGLGQNYRKAGFRNVIGSDEYVFNDPLINIPGIMISRFPYKEYHTADDTPDKINYDKILDTGKAIQEIIRVWEADYIPKRNFKGPLMRSKYGIQTPNPQLNLSYDYFFYSLDGKKSIAELCCEFGLNFDFTLAAMNKMLEDGQICRVDSGEVKKPKTTRKKSKGV